MPRAPAVITALVAMILASASAAAPPTIESKEADAQAIVARVQGLGAEINVAVERFNGANYRLSKLSEELRRTRSELVRVRKGYRHAERRFAKRLVEVYTSDDTASTMDLILGADSLESMLESLELSERVADQDADLVDDFRSFRAQLTQREQRIRAARAKQVDVVKARAAERAAIEAKLAEQQRLLSSVRAEIVRLREQELARQAELARRTRAALAAQRTAARAANQAASTEPEVQAAEPSPPPAPTAPEPPPPPADGSRGAQVVAIAMRYLGVPYRWGGASPSTGFDCSGLTMYVYAQIGISLPHYSGAQYGMGRAVSRDQLAPGDLVFFRGLGHMGMYVGGGNYIHAPQTGDVVKISSLNDSYAIRNWVGARRIL